MGDDYLWVWADRNGRHAALKIRGELDAVTAGRFAAEAFRELRQAPGPVTVDLSFVDFIDAAGARVLQAVLDAVPPWRLTGVSGIQPAVARLLELIGMDLSAPAGLSEVALSCRGRQLLAQAHEIRCQSQEVLLEASAAMARLATTYAELAAARERRAAAEHDRAAHMQQLSDTARTLAARCRERARCAPASAGPELAHLGQFRRGGVR